MLYTQYFVIQIWMNQYESVFKFPILHFGAIWIYSKSCILSLLTDSISRAKHLELSMHTSVVDENKS